MDTLKVRIMILALLLGFGYFIIPMTLDNLLPLYDDPTAVLEPLVLWTLVGLLIVLAVWIYSLAKVGESIYLQFRFGTREQQVTKEIDSQMASLDVFMDVARKEFMKRRISKDTFEEIQRIAGKKMVELKARKKELEQKPGPPGEPGKGKQI